MGAKQIILTGFDLGFKNGRFHPVDQPQPYYHDEPPPAENRLHVEANDGGTIETELSMQFYRQEFECRVAGCQPPIINATAGGARIAGTRYQPLEKTLSALPPLPEKPLADLPSLPPLPKIGSALARMANEIIQPPSAAAGLQSALKNNPAYWRFISEAINPALSTGVVLLLEDVQQNIPGAEDELREMMPHLQETRQQLLEIVRSLATLRWPRKPTNRAFSFASPTATEKAARNAGLELVEHHLDPDQLPVLWQAVEDEKIDTLIMENGTLLPAAWSFPGLRCLSLRTKSEAPALQAEHRVPGLQEL